MIDARYNKKRMQEAIETGEILKVIYYGGSHPGSQREVLPLTFKDDKVIARCFKSNTNKMFLLEKIEIIDGAVEAPEWVAGKTVQKYDSIVILLEKEEGYITSFGWHIKSDFESLSLHGRHQNGKIRKVPAVELRHNPFSSELYYDPDEEIVTEIQTAKQKPWRLTGNGTSAKHFGSL